jgi:hypothetical protein
VATDETRARTVLLIDRSDRDTIVRFGFANSPFGRV